MMAGKLHKYAIYPRFVSRVSCLEKVEVLSKVEKITGVSLPEVSEYKLRVKIVDKNKYIPLILNPDTEGRVPSITDKEIGPLKKPCDRISANFIEKILPFNALTFVHLSNINNSSTNELINTFRYTFLSKKGSGVLKVSHGRNLYNSFEKTLLSKKVLNLNTTSYKYCTQISESEKKKLDIQEITSKINENNIKLFSSPKNTLDNIYTIVKNEKGLATPLLISFKTLKGKWTCTYELKWPQERIFVSVDNTKRKASTKCAELVLQYLLANNHISKSGFPVLYSKEDIDRLSKENVPTLELFDDHITKLDEILNLHTAQILPAVEKNMMKTKDLSETNVYEQEETYRPKFLAQYKYKCIEDLHLPISDYKEEIIKKIEHNRVVIVKGEPGCGKSTRLPQYILEGWSRNAEETGKNCNIIVTEPRRIAAISLAQRVASERNEEVGSVVGFKVRFNSGFNRQLGRIMYCTNGILLQVLKTDPTLSNYTHIVIDEAHERDINTDLLLSMLRELLNVNPSLKVIIMSATINTELFVNYFEGSSVIHIPGFTYPVRSHFLGSFGSKLEKTNKICKEFEPSVCHEEVAQTLIDIHEEKPEGAILCFLPGWEDIRKIRDLIPDSQDIMVLCLHSRLQDSEQWRIFNKAPNGVRKIILATNIAETSVTINDVVYVVDTGIHKETRFDISKGSMCIDNHWISRSNVEQRKGRAGRVKPGECFHMYPKSKMDSLPQFSVPEILRVSLTKVVLDTRAFKSNKKTLDFFNKLPTPPKKETVQVAVEELMDLELIDSDEQLTPLGRVLHHFQLEPKLAKALVNSVIYKCVSPVVDIVTLYSAGIEMFSNSLERKEEIRNLKANFSKSSDHIAMMKIFEVWNQFIEEGDHQGAQKFLKDFGLVPAKMKFLNSLKQIHYNYIRNGLNTNVLPVSDEFSDDDEMVKAVLFSGIGTFLTHKNWDIVKSRIKKRNVFSTRMNQNATVTPESVNFKKVPKKGQFFFYINETRSNVRRLTLIRESSLIPAIMVLMFSNRKLKIKEIDPKHYSPKLSSKDQVKIELAGSKMSFLMERWQAMKLMECKSAIKTMYDHYIFQVTEGGEPDQNLDESWDHILRILAALLNDFRNP